MLKFVAGFATGIIVAALGLAATVGITYRDNSLTKTDDSSPDIAEKDTDQQIADTAEKVETEVAECSETTPAEDDTNS